MSNPDSPSSIIEMAGVAFGSMQDLSCMVAEEVHWTVTRGDFWVIGGLHGTGKSDLLLLAAGLLPPARGSYRYFGEPMPAHPEERLADRLRLGLVFDNAQLFNHLTVAENIALPLRYHRDWSAAEASGRVRELIEALELTPWAERAPGSLGRNWQKRVGLGRALAMNPELLLVDNPLGGLDPRQAQWWLHWLDRLARGDQLTPGRVVTIVVTAADLRPWKNHARQFAVLRGGRLEVLDDWDTLRLAAGDLIHEPAGPG
jgi:ABC-type transporter Mla maintaining outer membrane lipid asymmetry ATPase subunit MlaF